MHHGERLVNALSKVSNKPTGIEGKYVPMTCSINDTDDENYCIPVTMEDDIYVNDFFDKESYGTISFLHGSDNSHTLKYKQAEYMTAV